MNENTLLIEASSLNTSIIIKSLQYIHKYNNVNMLIHLLFHRE